MIYWWKKICKWIICLVFSFLIILIDSFFIPPIWSQIHFLFFHIKKGLNIFVSLKRFIIPLVITSFKYFCSLINHYYVMSKSNYILILFIFIISQQTINLLKDCIEIIVHVLIVSYGAFLWIYFRQIKVQLFGIFLLVLFRNFL